MKSKINLTINIQKITKIQKNKQKTKLQKNIYKILKLQKNIQNNKNTKASFNRGKTTQEGCKSVATEEEPFPDHLRSTTAIIYFILKPIQNSAL